MEPNEISLKNLYRLLTVKDYPVYSDGVLPARNRKGVTLVSFWRYVLIPEWKDSHYGQIIWNSARRSRYLSYFCNRKGEFPFYDAYQKEILDSLTPAVVLQQISNIRGYLNSLSYNTDIFYNKITYFIESSCADGLLSRQDKNYIKENYSQRNRGQVTESFADAWIFTLLAVLAMSGNDKGIRQYMKVLQQEDYRLLSLHTLEQEQLRTALPMLRHSGEVWGAAEDMAMFFGREKEFYDLIEAVETRRKVFVTGIGGIGKTEMLRQLLHSYIAKKSDSIIVSVQYDEGLMASFVRCFYEPEGSDLTEKFQHCLYQIRKSPQEKTIILIDNAETEEEEQTAWQELSLLSCPVIVTSRGTVPGGFGEIKLSILHERAALLMLRRHYSRVLTETQKQRILSVMESHEVLRHPLTIRLFAGAANHDFFSIDHMEALILEENGVRDTIASYPVYQRIYRSMYRTEKLPADQLLLLRLLSVLPYEQYSDLQIRNFCGLPDTLCKKALDVLTRKGWVEKKAETYSMHPLIAECIHEEGFPESVFAGFIAYATERLGLQLDVNYEAAPQLEDDLPLYRCVVSIARHLTGSLSESCGRLIVKSFYILSSDGQLGYTASGWLQAVMAKMQAPSNIVKLFADIAFICMRKAEDMDSFVQRLQEYIKDVDLPDRDVLTFGANLVMIYVCYHHTPERCMPLLSALKGAAVSPFARILYYNSEMNVYIEQMQAEKAVESLDELLRIYDELPEQDRSTSINNIVRHGILFRGKLSVIMQNAAEARYFLTKAREIRAPHDSLLLRLAMMDLEAKILRLEGKDEEAIRICRDAAEILGKLHGETELEYLSMRGELAISLIRIGRTDEAIAIYDDCIEKFRRRYSSQTRLQIWLNNRGVALITANRPEEAIRSLLEAGELAENMEDIAKAEVHYNLVKAYRLMQDTERDKEYLLLASPVFTAFYGSENAKTAYVRERLSELTTKTQEKKEE